jgi:hypothetical protein
MADQVQHHRSLEHLSRAQAVVVVQETQAAFIRQLQEAQADRAVVEQVQIQIRQLGVAIRIPDRAVVVLDITAQAERMALAEMAVQALSYLLILTHLHH